MLQSRRFISLILLAFCMLPGRVAAGDERHIDAAAARAVCEGWMTAVVHHEGAWAGSTEPSVAELRPLLRDGVQVGWRCDVHPEGFVVVPLRRELSPIKFSSVSGFGRDDDAGVIALVRDDLADRLALLDGGDRPVGPEHPAWARLLDDGLAEKGTFEGSDPLLTTRWQQGWPFNATCPGGDGGRTYVGCTALAAAQLMRYHRWPDHGRGESAYWWSGDENCGGTTEGDTLRAVFSDSYDWDHMPDEVTWDAPVEVQDAVAELCYETAVACRMDFSFCGSAASISRARSALVNSFRYAAGARDLQRFRMSDDAWFNEIRYNIERGLPMIYASTIHSMVCDGWREIDDLRQVHINYGWGGESDGWFALDAIETSLNPYAERMISDLEPDTSTPIRLDSFTVVRDGVVAKISWRVAGAEDAGPLHVWREGGNGLRDRLTSEPLPVEQRMSWVDTTPPAPAVAYWLEELLPAGGSAWYGPARLSSVASAAGMHLGDPYPNPCNPSTTFVFTLDRPGRVRVAVHDAAGRRVALLMDGAQGAGTHALIWNGQWDSGRPAASGPYLLYARGPGSVLVRKLTLVR